MERLSGPTSLQAVCHRFSDGVDVVKCVAGFIKDVGETEQSYSTSLEKLIRSPLYNFHSNFLTQLLGSTPYQEIGTVKHTWERLGEELNLLAKLHAEKAQAYQESVRQPLIDLMPTLEEKRKELKNKARQLRADLDAAEARHLKEKTTYLRMAGSVDRGEVKLAGAKPHSTAGPKAYMNLRNEAKQEVKKAEFNVQEGVYREAHRKHVEARDNFDKECMELYTEIQKLESERVMKVKDCLKKFTSILSNTAPAYLETMQRMTMSVEEIDATSDIKSFVELQLQKLEQDEKGKGLVPALDIRSSNHTGESPTHNGRLPGSRRASRDEEDDKDVTGAEKEKNSKKNEDKEKERVEVREAEERREAERDAKMNTASSPRAPLNGPREEKVSATQDRNLPPAAPPPAVRSVAIDNSKPPSKPPSKPRKKPSLLTKPSSSDTPSTDKASPTVSRKMRPPQTAPRTGPSQLPNGHINSHPGVGNPEAWNGYVEHSSTKKVAGSPKTSRKAAKKPVAPKPVSLQNGHAHSSSLQPSASPPSDGEPSSIRPNQKSRQWEGEEQEVRMLTELAGRARGNDYYGLLGASPESTNEELAKARRERSRELHPDHCANDEKQRIRNEEKLTLINQAYQNVLQNETTRESYNVLCSFRKRYAHILQQDSRKLVVAESRLNELRKRLKKAHVPEALLQEMDCALKLIQTRLGNLQEE